MAFSAQARFERHYLPVPETGCWLWEAATNPAGYGMFAPVGTKAKLAHRFSYELHKGPIPAGLVLDHTCSTPACVNPDHLEPVTGSENARRSHQRGKYVNNGAHFAAKTHCPEGHEYSAENTYVNPKGSRICRECARQAVRALRARNRGGK